MAAAAAVPDAPLMLLFKTTMAPEDGMCSTEVAFGAQASVSDSDKTKTKFKTTQRAMACSRPRRPRRLGFARRGDRRVQILICSRVCGDG